MNTLPPNTERTIQQQTATKRATYRFEFFFANVFPRSKRVCSVLRCSSVQGRV